MKFLSPNNDLIVGVNFNDLDEKITADDDLNVEVNSDDLDVEVNSSDDLDAKIGFMNTTKK